MQYEIIESPLAIDLVGLSSTVENNVFGEVGFRLMNQLWKIVKDRELATTGINHWVYPSNSTSMFVGVQLKDDAQSDSSLQTRKIRLRRYLQHTHVGPYHQLPAKWRSLKLELSKRGDAIEADSLEIYGHHCEDESKLETTILIGLS